MEPIYDAYGEGKYHRVMNETWGHLKPKKNHTYYGYIVFSFAEDGLICLLARDFKGMPGSPWEYEAIQSFVDALVDLPEMERGEVYRWEGVMYNYTFKGHITHIPTKVAFDKLEVFEDDPVFGLS